MRQIVFLTLFFVFACFANDTTNDNNESPHEAELNLHVDSPDWRDQIIYFLMIDRFYDGDPSNNNLGAGEYDPAKESHYNGGDLSGVVEKIDYIKNLGATSVWITPPVANQWWSNKSQYSGYHGYWARDFGKVDEHYGSLGDYKLLSHSLHNEGMFLIQDIVVNHTGNFFGYKGEYDPADTARNFEFFESGEQATPEMPPFHLIDRHNPEHAKANIYNWTPPAIDFTSEEQQYTYQLGTLADINTKHPEVLSTFKDVYRYWMEEVGVDAYRIDTVKYVEHEFWHHFLHDNDGIYSHATALGKDHFLTFGEVFDPSPVYSNSGEKKLVSFLGTKQKPELNSVIGFPLYFEIGNVLGEGQPTKQLAYRLEQHMTIYPDPFVIPNFVDNHDTKRFLAASSQDALKQSLALIYTIPGIPVVYQGTEQAMVETRQAMFAGGYLNDEDKFDQNSEFYRYLAELAKVRTENRLFSRGTMTVLGANESGPGLLAYKRSYENKDAIVLFNTADHSILLNGLATGLTPGSSLESILTNVDTTELRVNEAGKVNGVLPARAIKVMLASKPQASKDISALSHSTIEVKQDIDGKVFSSDIPVSGTAAPNASLIMILNGNLDLATSVEVDEDGHWQTNVPVRDFGTYASTLEFYDSTREIVSNQYRFTTTVTVPSISAVIKDPEGDAKGPMGEYSQPLQPASKGQMEILSVSAQSAGANLKLTLTMKEISDAWVPANGFDNVSFSVFFDTSADAGARDLPLLNHVMPDGLSWDIAHVAYGWGNYMYDTDGASSKATGGKLGVSPNIKVDKANNNIEFTYQGRQFGIDNWENTSIYITSWDISGEGSYREVSPKGGEWVFGGGKHSAPKVLDDVLIKLGAAVK